MAAETDITVQLLGRKWHVQLDETDVSHAVVYVTMPTGAPATAEIGISIPVGLSNPGLDPAYHRLMDYVGAEKRDSRIVIKYGDAIIFTGREAQVSNVRISTDETSFKMSILASPAGRAVGADTGNGSGCRQTENGPAQPTRTMRQPAMEETNAAPPPSAPPGN